jgi:hypothetical protein
MTSVGNRRVITLCLIVRIKAYEAFFTAHLKDLGNGLVRLSVTHRQSFTEKENQNC